MLQINFIHVTESMDTDHSQGFLLSTVGAGDVGLGECKEKQRLNHLSPNKEFQRREEMIGSGWVLCASGSIIYDLG